jgi:putative FmdB family regulatory protein
MPIYDFKCPYCGYEHEVLCKSDVVVECSECGCEMYKKASAPAIHFKGGGWTENPHKTAREDKALLGKAKKELQNETV